MPNTAPFLHEPVSLSVRDLVVRRGERIVVAGASFVLASGQGLALRGPNGAGKSSLLLALAGLLGADAGEIAWNLPDPERAPREMMHFLGHLPGVKPALSVEENLIFAADLFGGIQDLVPEALERAGLAGLSRIEAGLLSAGQTRRLALARFLVARRPVWLLDEPTSALDAQGSDWVSGMIGAHLDEGGMVIYATHLDLPVETDPRFSRLTLTPLPTPAGAA